MPRWWKSLCRQARLHSQKEPRRAWESTRRKVDGHGPASLETLEQRVLLSTTLSTFDLNAQLVERSSASFNGVVEVKEAAPVIAGSPWTYDSGRQSADALSPEPATTTLTGTGQADLLVTRDIDTQLVGRGGDDTLIVSIDRWNGVDSTLVRAGKGDDVIHVTAGKADVRGGAGYDILLVGDAEVDYRGVEEVWILGEVGGTWTRQDSGTRGSHASPITAIKAAYRYGTKPQSEATLSPATTSTLRSVSLSAPSIAMSSTMGGATSGDLDGDGDEDATDIDLLVTAINGQSTDLTYDLNLDGLVSSLDQDYLIRDLLGTEYGDANLDGRVFWADHQIWLDNFGDPVGWAGADFNGSGVVDASDYTVWADHAGFGVPALPDLFDARGDLNANGVFDTGDVELMLGRVGQSVASFPDSDLFADGVIDQKDVDHLVQGYMSTRFEDLNLDGVVDGTDGWVVLGNFITGVGSTWSEGDLNGDGVVDLDDYAIVTAADGFDNEKPVNLTGTPGDDILYGYRGYDVIDGGVGKDYIWGGQREDVLDGGPGIDMVGNVEPGDTLSNFEAWVSAAAASFDGGVIIEEGGIYTLNLALTEAIATSWTIGWGDGSEVEVLPGTTQSAPHVYADGDSVHGITATASDGTNTYSVSGSQSVGDFNRDGSITIDDGYAALFFLTPLGSLNAPWDIHLVGDLNGDGIFSQDDFSFLSDAINNGTPTGSFVPVQVLDVAPALSITGSSAVEVGQTYSLTLDVTDPGDDVITQWSIDWGDNSDIEIWSGSASLLTHSYTNTGTFDISVTATDEDGTYTKSVSVAVDPQFTADLQGIGDFNQDGQTDTTDIDLLYSYIDAAGPSGQPQNAAHRAGDLFADSILNQKDVDHLVWGLLGTQYGDVNLDGRVDQHDADLVSPYLGTSVTGWSQGDFDGDGDHDGDDQSILTANQGFNAYTPVNLTGTSSNDILYGFRGDDIISGGDGHDFLWGGAGSDNLDGDAGADIWGDLTAEDASLDHEDRDTDFDGVTNFQEVWIGSTDPESRTNSDTDEFSDDWEVFYGFDILTPNDGNIDTDGDLLTDSYEMTYGTNPNLTDSDFDGNDDHTEIYYGTNALVYDGGGAFTSDLSSNTIALGVYLSDTASFGFRDNQEPFERWSASVGSYRIYEQGYNVFSVERDFRLTKGQNYEVQLDFLDGEEEYDHNGELKPWDYSWQLYFIDDPLAIFNNSFAAYDQRQSFIVNNPGPTPLYGTHFDYDSVNRAEGQTATIVVPKLTASAGQDTYVVDPTQEIHDLAEVKVTLSENASLADSSSSPEIWLKINDPSAGNTAVIYTDSSRTQQVPIEAWFRADTLLGMSAGSSVTLYADPSTIIGDPLIEADVRGDRWSGGILQAPSGLSVFKPRISYSLDDTDRSNHFDFQEINHEVSQIKVAVNIDDDNQNGVKDYIDTEYAEDNDLVEFKFSGPSDGGAFFSTSLSSNENFRIYTTSGRSDAVAPEATFVSGDSVFVEAIGNGSADLQFEWSGASSLASGSWSVELDSLDWFGPHIITNVGTNFYEVTDSDDGGYWSGLPYSDPMKTRSTSFTTYTLSDPAKEFHFDQLEIEIIASLTDQDFEIAPLLASDDFPIRYHHPDNPYLQPNDERYFSYDTSGSLQYLDFNSYLLSTDATSISAASTIKWSVIRPNGANEQGDFTSPNNRTFIFDPTTESGTYIAFGSDADEDGYIDEPEYFTKWILNPHVGVAVDYDRSGTIKIDGSDATSENDPFVFWVNNDAERAFDDSYVSDISIDDPFLADADTERIGHNGSTVELTRQTIQRDLEDFARMGIWIPTDMSDDLDIVFKLETTDPGMALRIHASPVKISNQANQLSALPHVLDPTASTELADAVYSWNNNPANPVTLIDVPANGFGSIAVDVNNEFNPWKAFDNGTDGHVIPVMFEGVGAGQGTLKITYNDGLTGAKVFETVLHLDLRDVRELYEEWTVDTPALANLNATDGTDPKLTAYQLTGGIQQTSTSGQNASDFAKTDEYFTLVHGWRMRPEERRQFADTTYKRLYWQGYTGTIGLYSWPTDWYSTDNNAGVNIGQLNFDFLNVDSIADPGNFNRSEEIAWHSAAGLVTLLNDKVTEYGESNVSALAHSMGGVVLSEALYQMAQQGQKIDTAILSQAALSSHFYNGSLPSTIEGFINTLGGTLDPFSLPDWFGNAAAGTVGSTFNSGGTDYFQYDAFPSTGQYAVGGVDPRFHAIGQATNSLVNFYNEEDYALKLYRANAIVGRPVLNGVDFADEYPGFGDFKYEIDYTAGEIWRVDDVGTRTQLQFANDADTYEAYAHLLSSVTAAIGAVDITSAGNGINPFTVNRDLGFSYGFTDARYDHSGQFHGTLLGPAGGYWSGVANLI